jgi:P-type Ca2+ transporter type 2C
VLLKGAFERVLDRCVNLRLDNGEVCPLDDQMVDDITKALIAKAREGYRIVGVAVGPDGGNMKHITAQNRSTELADSENYVHFEGGLCFVGYTCIKDPCRPEVKQSIVECKTAGINVIMITGDAKETAVAIAQELNIVEPGQNIQKTCFTGAEFEALTTTQKKNILKNTQLGKVFSRVEPRHKRELVKLLIDLVSALYLPYDPENIFVLRKFAP